MFSAMLECYLVLMNYTHSEIIILKDPKWIKNAKRQNITIDRK